MRPVLDGNGRHVGWEGPRSETHDLVMSRRRTFPAHLINRSWLVGDRTVHVVALKSRSTWQQASDGECVTLDGDEARRILSDIRGERHPGPMAWGLVVFLEWFDAVERGLGPALERFLAQTAAEVRDTAA